MTSEDPQHLESCIQEIFSILAKNDDNYLRMAYQVILEREIEPKGLTGWLDQLQKGLSRTALIQKLVESKEFKQRLEHLTGNPIWQHIHHKLHSARVEMVVTLLPPAKTILDIGGYAGNDPRGALLSFGYPYPVEKLCIVDLPPDQMMFPGSSEWPKKVREKNCEIEYFYTNMTDLSCFDEASFDLIWSGESIEHISTEDAEKVFSQAYKLLKPGGKLALDTPNRRATKLPCPDSYIHPEHKLEYYYQDLCELLEKHNFTIVQTKGLIELSESIATSSLEKFYQEFLASDNLNDNPDESYCFYLCCMRMQDV
jgi:SAM-dependent methyltransferase